MTKISMLFAVAAVTVLALTGCERETETTAPETTTPPAAETPATPPAAESPTTPPAGGTTQEQQTPPAAPATGGQQ